MPPLPRDPLDNRESFETSFLNSLPSLSAQKSVKPPRIGSRTLWRPRGPLGQLWELLEELWEAAGGVFKTKILFLRKIKAPAGALNTKTEFFEKIKAPAGALNTQTEFLRKIKAPAGTYKACRFLIFI